ncbi:hypothetical protein GY12_18035 [Micrococcus luteus]|nr:hypothetical protein GY12_18035 [Micrococcus luteus]
MQGQVLQVAQRRVRRADLIEPGEVRGERGARGLRASQSRGGYVVLLVVDVFLRAGPGHVLEQLEPGVDAPQRAGRGGDDGADPERTRAAVLQVLP